MALELIEGGQELAVRADGHEVRHEQVGLKLAHGLAQRLRAHLDHRFDREGQVARFPVAVAVDHPQRRQLQVVDPVRKVEHGGATRAGCEKDGGLRMATLVRRREVELPLEVADADAVVRVEEKPSPRPAG